MQPDRGHKPVEILLVEDNPGDARLTQEAFREGRVPSNVHVARDGVEAMDFLRGEDAYAGKPRPDLILLDLNMPRKDGREVLHEIKSDEDLRSIPVVVLTVSSDEKDILTAYNLNGNCYITKPVDLRQFMAVVQTLEQFWFRIVTLPPDGMK